MKVSLGLTDTNWNPISGCTKVSPGCKHCYAERVFPRIYGKQWYPGTTPEDGRPRRFTDIFLHSGRLAQPLHWRKPKRIVVNSMSDLFHEQVPMGFVMQVLGVAALCPQHTFQVLTKRPERMREMLVASGVRDWGVQSAEKLLDTWQRPYLRRLLWNTPQSWPLPNVWLGVSVENRDTLHRVDDLRATPAAVRFLLAEPLLENLGQLDLTGIHWVIVGGEFGHGAQPMHPDWVRSIRDQCAETGTPFFFKQWGEWLPHGQQGTNEGTTIWDLNPECWANRVGKKAAGRLLDGRTWKETPQ